MSVFLAGMWHRGSIEWWTGKRAEPGIEPAYAAGGPRRRLKEFRVGLGKWIEGQDNVLIACGGVIYRIQKRETAFGSIECEVYWIGFTDCFGLCFPCLSGRWKI